MPPNIYQDPSIGYGFAELQNQRLELEQEKQLRSKQRTDITRNLWGSYQKEQALKTKELIASKNYEVDPSFTEKNWLQRQFTPSGGRVKLSEVGQAGVDTGTYTDIQGPETMGGQIGETFEGVIGKGKDIFNKPISSVGGEGAEAVAGKTGITAGNVLSGVGTAKSAWDLYQNWNKRGFSEVDKGLGVIKTGLGAAATVPGPHSAIFGGLAAGVGLLDYFWD